MGMLYRLKPSIPQEWTVSFWVATWKPVVLLRRGFFVSWDEEVKGNSPGISAATRKQVGSCMGCRKSCQCLIFYTLYLRAKYLC